MFSLPLAIVFVFMSLPIFAQDSDPPPCCNNDPLGLPPYKTIATAPDDSSQVVISDTVLYNLGISRSQFIDLLSTMLFVDRNITFVISSSTTITPDPAAVLSSESLVGGQEPESIEVTRQYRLPKEHLRPEFLQAADRIVMTDGRTSIGIRFTIARPTALLPK